MKYILHRQGWTGGIAETFEGKFSPEQARKFAVEINIGESFFRLEDGAGNKIPLQVFDENGQIPFDAAIFYDDTMNVEDKKKWLSDCQSDYLDRLCHVCGESECMGEYTHYE